MNLGAVMQAIADRVDTITGLRVFGWPQGSIVPPAAVVGYPAEISFDETYARGMDRWSVPLVVFVGRPSERSTRDLIGVYCDGSGSSSIKAVVESGTYSAFDTVRVESVTLEERDVGQIPYLAAVFMIDVVGRGAV